jgi:small-conductance mechanosensitive channel
MLRSHKVLCLVLMLCIGAPGLRVANAQAQAPTQTQTQPTGTDSGQGQAPAPKSTLPPELTAPIDKMTRGIEAAEQAVQNLKELEEELGRLRVDVEGILNDSRDSAEDLRPRVAAIKDQIEKLGPQPAKDAPPEAASIAAERARLNTEAAELEGAIKAAELTWVRARQLIVRITEMRHALFTRNLFEQQPSPVLPTLWRRILSDSPAVSWRLRYLANDWMNWANREAGSLIALLLAVAVVYVIARIFVMRLTRRPPREPPPPFVERAVSAAWVAPTRIAPGVVAALAVYSGLDALELLYQPWEGLANGLFKGLMIFIGFSWLLQTVFAIREPQWRLFDLSDRAALRIYRILQGIATVYAIDLALTEMTRAFFIPLALSILQTSLVCLAYVSLLMALLLTPFEPREARVAMPSRHEPRWLKIPLWVLAFAILAGSVTGYVALARFVAQQLVMTGIVALVTAILYLAIRAVTREPAAPEHPIGQMLENRFGLDQPRRNQLARLTETSLVIVLGLCALPVLMLQWGFSGADIRDWFRSLFFGFEIGQFRISVARILIGLVLFTVLLLVTRLLQRWLRDRVLAQPTMDPGIANSIDTVAGYAGTAIAALIAISYAGFDITSLAIVAGALSVGIGFGLQSIVNNFVSGLILLVERPIKVGDWIVVGNEQGHVRRISVRATEIETFDRASLIVPNSELITGRVLNWTHRNLLGRVVLKVSVDQASDPEVVTKLLAECAGNHPEILKSPAPKVVLEGFGASTLDFSLRFLLGDLNRSLDVQSEMRTAILNALRAHGVSVAPVAAGNTPANALSLKVGVAHASAPERVIAILQKCADAHPQILKLPEPKALLERFGQNSLDFTLDFAVEDGAEGADVQSELRIAILNEFRAHGIEVPYAQHDIHLRDLEKLRAFLTKIAEERRAAGAKPAEQS